MFSKKINKKLADSSRHQDKNSGYLNLTRDEITKIHRRFETPDEPQEEPEPEPEEESFDVSSPPQQKSRSRLAAGFNSQNQDNRSKSNRKTLSDTQDDDIGPLQGSTDEIMEEFDVDNVQLEYPRQDYLSQENFIDYNELTQSTPSLPQNSLQLKTPPQLQIDPGQINSKRKKSVEQLKHTIDPQNVVQNNSRYFDTNFINDVQYGSTNTGQRTFRKPSKNLLNVPNSLEQQAQPTNLDSFNNSMLNLGQNNSTLNNSPSFTFTDPRDQRPNINSRDVIPLPIEIPDSAATDADAFRRYLSVRRGVSPFQNENDIDADEDDVERTLESLGSGRLGSSRNPGAPEILASTTRLKPFGGSGSASIIKPISSPGRGGSGGDGSCPPIGGNCNQSQYVTKTTSLSHAIMTLALLSASAAQLRFVVAYSHVHSYPTLNYFLICSCIIIEVLVGIGFVILARFNFQEGFVERIHSYLIFGLFIVTIANVIVAAFALDTRIFSKIDCNYGDPSKIKDGDDFSRGQVQ